MPEISTLEVKDFLVKVQGKEISLAAIRKEFNILSGTKSFDLIRNIMFQLAEQKIVRAIGSRDGIYKVIKPVVPVKIFGVNRERRPPFKLIFPKDFESKQELEFSYDVVVREGDLILISGVSNFGKTALCMNFCGENINQRPVLMGNEYTSPDGEPLPRFLNRMDTMDWIKWCDENQNDKFDLLPVMEDYAEHVVKDRINIIDWINIESGEFYMIGTLLNNIKRNLGRGVAIIAIQKAEGATAGRGGQFTKDFADLELLLDRYGENDVLLTVGKCKEFTKYITGKHYAYGIYQGVKLMNFREVKKCYACHGHGARMGKECDTCKGRKFIDVRN